MRYIPSNSLAKLTLMSLMVTPPLLAQDDYNDLPSLGASQGAQWIQVDGTMTPQEYQSAVQHNQRIISLSTKDFVVDGLISIGMSERSIGLTGSTLGFLTKGGGIFRLGPSDNFEVEVKNLDEDNGAMHLRYKFDW